jgi:glycosyltransferase involved in cell wall biosynthesis
MSDDRLVSIIIPAYNAELFIGEAIQSALRQIYPHIEVVIVDDGSTDSTQERIQAYLPGVKYLKQQNSKGFPGSPRNHGIANSHGGFICFLDADDIMLPDRVQRQIALLDRHPGVGFVFGDYWNFSASGFATESHFNSCPLLQGKLTQQSELILSGSEATGLLLRENVGLPSSLMIRREVLKCVSGFSTEFRIGEDFHFYYRLSKAFDMGIVNHVVTHRRLHGGNLTSESLRTLQDQLLSYSILRRSEDHAQNIKQLDRMLFRCELNLVRMYTNKREYRRSMIHNLRAIKAGAAMGFQSLGRAMWSLLRTAAVAGHIKTPTD